MEPTKDRRDDGHVRSDDTSAAHEPDLLYDAPYIVFVYAAWVAASYVMGDVWGLGVLIAGTTALTAAAARQPFVADAPRSFAADFAVILLFCASSIGVGVFAIDALSTR